MSELLKCGDKIGPYEIIEVIEGGMGIVYIVNDPYREPPDNMTPNALVLKTLKDKYLRSESASARFVREARTWISLMENAPDDVNVVKAYEIVRYFGKPYIVMEYVGPSLRYWLVNYPGRASPAEVLSSGLRLASGICNGMVYWTRRF